MEGFISYFVAFPVCETPFYFNLNPIKEVLCYYCVVQMRSLRKVRGLPLEPTQRPAREVTLQQSTADDARPLTAGL